MTRIALALAAGLFVACLPAHAAEGVPPGAAIAPAMPAHPATPVPLAQAFRDGKLELSVYVVPGYGDGRKLRVAVKNRTGEAMRVTIPAGATALAVGDPIGTLNLASRARRTLTIGAGKFANPVDLAQTGSPRAIDGTFWLYVEDGKPQFRGTVTTGDV